MELPPSPRPPLKSDDPALLGPRPLPLQILSLLTPLKKPTSLMTTIQPAWHAFQWHSAPELWEEKDVHPYTESPLCQQALSLRTKREKRGCGRLYMLLCFRWMWACSSKFTKHFTQRVWEGKFMSVCFDFPKMPWDCPFTTYPYTPKNFFFLFITLFLISECFPAGVITGAWHTLRFRKACFDRIFFLCHLGLLFFCISLSWIALVLH